MLGVDTVLLILIIHWIADFLLQTDYMASNKSHSMRALLMHVVVYTIATTVLWRVAGIVAPDAKSIAIVVVLTFVAHTATDFVTSRANAGFWRRQAWRPFFNMVGFDQLLHYGQLFGTWWLLHYRLPV